MFEIFGKNDDDFSKFFENDDTTMKQYGSCCKCCLMGKVLVYKNKEYCERCLKILAGETPKPDKPFLSEGLDKEEDEDDPFIKILRGK